METRNCQNCKQEFSIDTEDTEFYAQMNVSAPEMCPDCRSQLRTAFRNESILYKRKCDSSGKDIISIYSSDKPFKVFSQDAWWGDSWDPMNWARDYDFNRPFFEQFKELMKDIPRLSIVNKQSVNSDYCNYSNSNKNCYLCFGGHENEDCGYCWYNWKDTNCYDCLSVIKSELTYESNFGNNLYDSSFLEYCFDCTGCHFSFDLVGCSDCFLSANLRKKQYYFLNQPYSKEEYEQKVKEFLSGSYAKQQEARQKFAEIKKQAIKMPTYQKNCVDCLGGDLMYCKNVKYGFDSEYCEDSKYIYPKATQVYSSMDTNKMGYDRSDFCYQTIGCAGLNNCKFCDTCWGNNDLSYCNLCFSSANLFGCIGLRSKSYCILNKQYSKEEYQELLPKIIEHMQSTGEWGKFFSAQLSPFGYNETTAQEYTPLAKSDAENLGFSWKEPEMKSHQPDIKAEELPDNISEVDDSITSKIIACSHKGECKCQCATAFRIAPEELKFYKRQNLPLPRLCNYCRHQGRLESRNPLKLWDGKCQKCSGDIKTSYPPENNDVVYCKECYQKEIV